MALTDALISPGFCTASPEGAQQFVENLVGFYVIMEGIFFYSGFAMMLAFHRQNRMTGVGQQFQVVGRHPVDVEVARRSDGGGHVMRPPPSSRHYDAGRA
jgi:hypothetical protein